MAVTIMAGDFTPSARSTGKLWELQHEIEVRQSPQTRLGWGMGGVDGAPACGVSWELVSFVFWSSLLFPLPLPEQGCSGPAL